jgi:hypothetical protein
MRLLSCLAVAAATAQQVDVLFCLLLTLTFAAVGFAEVRAGLPCLLSPALWAAMMLACVAPHFSLA